MRWSTLSSLSASQKHNGGGKYYPYGECRNSPDGLGTDKLFTGQRLDSTGLYYYNARYYNPTIGRFISPDSIIPDPANPQAFNRYSYCLNNPLKYVDPSGNFPFVLVLIPLAPVITEALIATSASLTVAVASNSGSGQVVGWSSSQGYYAVSTSSYDYYYD
ncbi:RHS repeat-associated core domain-containing protein [Chloroflexota bacterium]